MMKKIFLGLAIVLVVLQLVRPARNLSASTGPQDITVQCTVPAGVQSILTKACYDCHSDNTRYPWYANVQPAGWWLAWHIHEGKRHLNFSEFGAYDFNHAQRKLKQISKEINSHGMPLDSYTWIHRDAILTAVEIKLVNDWAAHSRCDG